MSETFAIEATELRKRYDQIEALRGMTLQVPKGSIAGFLGRNGAGKTTAIKVLLGMTRPTSGRARVLGFDVTTHVGSLESRRRIGFVGEEKELYPAMTTAQIIRFTAAFYPSWRRDLEDKYVRAFGLPLDRRIRSLSHGTRTKLALLLALCRGAEVLVLDEPTSGLDPAAIEEVLQALVAHVAREPLTVFFSSHHLAEVEQIADYVAIVHDGRTAVEGDLDALRHSYRRVDLVFERDTPDLALDDADVRRVRRDGRAVSLLTCGNAERIVERARALGPTSIDVVPVTLKEIFLDVVTREG